MLWGKGITPKTWFSISLTDLQTYSVHLPILCPLVPPKLHPIHILSIFYAKSCVISGKIPSMGLGFLFYKQMINHVYEVKRLVSGMW